MIAPNLVQIFGALYHRLSKTKIIEMLANAQYAFKNTLSKSKNKYGTMKRVSDARICLQLFPKAIEE